MWKRLHHAPPLVDIDPAFNTKYDESKHAAMVALQLKIDRFMHRHYRDVRDVRGLIIEIWPVFDNLGVTKTCRDCACLIDNDTHLPIVYCGVTYGLHGTLIIQKAINPLLDLKQIHQVSDGG